MFIAHLKDDIARSVDLVGGKGASLARLISLGVPCTDGFCITTEAYANQMDTVRERSDSTSGSSQQSVLSREQLSAFRQHLHSIGPSAHLEQAVAEAYAELERCAKFAPLRVAVRSSATAEDRGDASFAGQYDTFLNVFGVESVLECAKKCWASHWSERAYYYRNKQSYDHWGSRMAVIVQEMVPAEASGTIFTINPVTKNAQEMVVEACWGLGELLVSGRVIPDTYTVQCASGLPVITKKIIKTKRKMLLPRSYEVGGTVVVETPGSQADSQVIGDDVIIDLYHIGSYLSDNFKRPQDIEWAWCQGDIFILQSRPVTAI